MLTLRRYQSSDKDAVWNLHNTALSATGAHAGNGPWDSDLSRIEEIYLQDGEFVVGLIEDTIVAMGAIKRTSDVRAELKRIRVHPHYQGQGLGQQVLTYLEQRARELGFTTLHLDTSDRQETAQRLYCKNNYQEVGQKPWRGMTMIFYEKNL